LGREKLQPASYEAKEVERPPDIRKSEVIKDDERHDTLGDEKKNNIIPCLLVT
jgi:hypothetical protein